MTYLEEHPPARSQFRKVRRAAVTGSVVVHSAENHPDLTLPDGGAESVARFIATRDTPGSYHSVVDSDSIVRVGRYEWEMFHEGTGGNRWSLGLSFACQASQWTRLPDEWVVGAIDNGAIEAARMAAWVKETVGVTVPARLITPAQYRAGQPGFISHAELDPGRRSDPGAAFPWHQFLTRFAEITGRQTEHTMHEHSLDLGTVKPDDVSTVQKHVNRARLDAGQPVIAVDKNLGPQTWGGIRWALLHRTAQVADLGKGVAARDQTIRDQRDRIAEQADRIDELTDRITELQNQQGSGTLTDRQMRLIQIGQAVDTILGREV